MTHSACLSGDAAANHLDCDVVLAAALGQVERGANHFVVSCARSEIVLYTLAVDYYLPVAGVEPHASHCALAPARAVEICRLCFCASCIHSLPFGNYEG